MPHPCPHHCPPGRGQSTAALVAFVVLAVIIAAAARAIVHAAELVLEVAAIAVTSAVVLAVFGGVAYIAVRARRSRPNGITPGSFPAPVARRGVQAVSAPRRRAIEAPRANLADLEDLAAEYGYDIVRRDRGD